MSSNYETKLAARIAQIAEPNVSAFAKKAGIGESSMRQYIDGSTPGLAKAVAIADAAGVSLEWLATGRGAPTAGAVNESPGHYKIISNFAMVPRYDVTVIAGHGALSERGNVIDYMAFPRPWLIREGLHEVDLALIQARGDSMEPTISTGDLLLVDLRENIPRDDGIYVIQTDFHLVSKRVQRMFDGSIYIRSDNPAYDPQQLDEAQVEQLTIVGRVVWVARRL
jgi:phage repressor protein C with HTH and peptisase S24 domain